MTTKVKSKYATKISLEEGLDSVKSVMKERYLSKNDFKSEFCVIETKLSESSIEQAKIVK